MSNKNNIDDLFRRSETRLTRRPSPRTWDRLESRLDNHNMRGANKPNPWMKYAGMVAAVLVLALAASTLTMFTNQNPGNQYAMLDTDLMDISSYKNNSFVKYVDYQKEYLKSDKIFAEGDIERGFIRKPIETNNARDESLAEAKIRKKEKKSEARAKPKNITVRESEKLKDFDPVVEEIKESPAMNGFNNNANGLGNTLGIDDSSQSDELALESFTEAEDEREEAVESSVPPNTTTPNPPPSSSSGTPGAIAHSKEDSKPDYGTTTKSNVVASYDLNRDEESFMDVSSESEEDKNDNPLSQFAWLIGEWKEKGRKGSESIEVWRQIDDYTIQSNGLLKVNGVALFSDKITLRRKGENLVLETQTNNSPQTLAFDFKEWDNDMAIFENGTDRISIQKNSRNKFTILFDGISSFDLDYLQQRNQLQSNQAIREMKRK